MALCVPLLLVTLSACGKGSDPTAAPSVTTSASATSASPTLEEASCPDGPGLRRTLLEISDFIPTFEPVKVRLAAERMRSAAGELESVAPTVAQTFIEVADKLDHAADRLDDPNLSPSDLVKGSGLLADASKDFRDAVKEMGTALEDAGCVDG